jgi:hypothetical protein
MVLGTAERHAALFLLWVQYGRCGDADPLSNVTAVRSG